jgi:hypothetical protein
MSIDNTGICKCGAKAEILTEDDCELCIGCYSAEQDYLYELVKDREIDNRIAQKLDEEKGGK